MANYDDIAAKMADEQTAVDAPGTMDQPAPEPAAAPANKWDGIASQYAQDLGAGLHHNISQAITTPADQAVKAQKIAADTMLPVDTAKANLSTLEQEREARRIADVVKASPALAEFYGVQDNADAAHDDVDNLWGIQKQFYAIKSGFTQGQLGLEQGDLGWKLLNNNASAEEARRMAEIDKELSGLKDYGQDGWVSGIAPAVAQSAPYMGAVLYRSLDETAVGGAAGAGAGFFVGGVGAIPGGVAGAGIGNTIGRAVESGKLEAGQAYWQFSQLKDEITGEPIDPAIAKNAAYMVGVANGALESTGMGIILKKVPGGQELIKRLSREGVQEALKNPTVRQTFMKYAKDIAEGSAGEGFTEATQQVVQIMAGEAAKYASSLKEGKQYTPITFEEAIAQVGEAFMVGAQGGGGTVAVLQAPVVVNDLRRAKAAQDAAPQIEQLNATAAQSKLLPRDPVKFHEAATKMVEATESPQQVYIPADKLVGYFQSQGVDPYSVADAMPGVGRDNLQRAVDTGNDVAVPLADYMTVLAKDHGEALKGDIKFSTDAMTLNQAAEFEAEADTLVLREVEAAQATAARDAQTKQVKDQVYEDVLGKLTTAGQSRITAEPLARLHAEFAGTQAESEGQAGADLVQQRYQALDIQGSLPSRQVAPRQADTGLIMTPETRQALEAELQPEERQFINEAVQIKRSINAIQAPTPVTPEEVQKRLGLDSKPQTLLQMVEKLGGIKSGLKPEELQNLKDAKKKGTLTKGKISKYYSGEVMAIFDGQPERIISRYVKTDGRSIEDDLPYAAAEAGYLGEDLAGRGYQNDARDQGNFEDEAKRRFAAALRQELGGEPVYSYDIQQRLQEMGYQDSLNLDGRDANLAMLDPFGITPDSGLADIARALAKMPRDENGIVVQGDQTYFQPAPPAASDAFTQWFTGSKMVDNNGNPLVLYHGTADDVTHFDLAHPNRKDTGWAGEGVYLTDKAPLANAYANLKRGNAGANVMPVYASIKNPYQPENAMATKAELRAGGKEAAVQFTESLQAMGYDGVVLTYQDGTREIIAFEPGQVKSVFNRGTWNAADPMVLNQDATREQNLAAFMEGSKVVDENGEPLVVYHGTTGDFDTFDRMRANPESDLGAGFYFTNNRDDVGSNYAGEGPDLTNKIQREAERIASETDRDYADPAVVEEAKAKFKTNDGNTMPVYLSMKNPAILGGPDATVLDFNEAYDEETDSYGEPTGKMVDVMNAIQEVADEGDWYDVDAGQAIASLQDIAYDEPTADQAIEAMKNSEGLQYVTNENGDLAVNEFIRQVFERAGFDGFIDNTVNVKFGSERKLGQSMAGMDVGTVHYIAFRPEQIKSALGNRGTFDPTDTNILHQNQNGKKNVAPRGQIQFTTAENGARQTLISLFKSHDNSTFLHESAHFFLENLFDLAELPNASDKLKNDTKAILDWFGVESRAQVGVDQHEMWARGFEQFVMKGKAPSSALREAFARFRAWLVGIYRSAKALNIEITPEIEGVMKRMLASQDEVTKAERANYLETMFSDLEALRKAGADVTGAEWEDYQELAAKAHDDAAADVMGKLVAEQRRETRKWWKEEREKVVAEEQESVNTNPVYQAAHWLAKGTLPDGSQANAPHAKLSYYAVADLLGNEDLVKQLPRYYGLMVVKHGGIHPDVVADLFGLGSGEELVQKLLTSPNPRDVVQQRADATMVERHGDALRDGTIEELATEALHNDARGELMARELDMLNKLAQKGRPPTPASILKQSAERTMRERTVAQAVQFDTYLAAERRAANAAQRAFAKGDFELAIQEKRKQLLNHYMAQFAKGAKNDTDRFLKFIKKFDSKGTRKALERDYLDQIDGLLERFAFTGSISGVQEARETSFAQFAKRMEENKQELVYDDKLLNEAYRRHFKELSWTEFSGLMDTVRNLEHLARLTQKAIVEVEQEMFEDQVNAIADTMEINKPARRESPNMERTATEKFVNGLELVDAEHTKMEFLFEDADGYQPLGTVWQNFYGPLKKASDRELEMMKDVANGWRDAFSSYTPAQRKEMFGKRHWVPEFNKNVTKGWIMSLALNWGNEGNRKAVLDANWGTASRPVKVDEAAVQRVLDKFMTKQDWETVQKVWDLIDGLWPEIAKLERELSGVVPQKVEAVPVNTAHGQFKGGYYPLKYDPEHNKLAERRAEKDIAEGKYGGNYLRAATKHGHTKERVGSAGQRPLMTLNVAVDHLYNAVHDVTHRKAILNAVRLIENDKVRAAFAERYGSHYPRIIMKWLNSVAADTNQPANRVEKLLSAVRSNTTVVYMGWKMTTIFAQLSGFTNSAYIVGEKELAKGMAKFYAKGPVSMKEGLDYAFSKSTELRNRRHNFDREVRNELLKLEKGDKQFMIRQSFFYMIGWMDMMVAAPTWLAAYEKGQGMFKGDEAKAIEFADQAVRMAQSSGLAKDLAVIQSSGGDLFKIFTMFYSFFSVSYNQFRRVSRQFDYTNPTHWPKAMVALAHIWLVPALMGAFLAGNGPDDDEDWLTWGAKEVALFPFSSVVLLRDVASYVARPYFGAQVTPLEGALRSLGDTVGALKDGDIDRKDLHAAFDLAGFTWGLPTKQMWATGEFMYDWMDGRVEPENPVEAAQGLLFGKRALE